MEILVTPRVSISQETLLDMHSILNVYNVIVAELGLLSLELENPAHINRLIDDVVDRARALGDRERARQEVDKVDGLIRHIEDALSAALKATPGAEARPSVERSVRNLASLFSIMRIRAEEIAARVDDPDAWVKHDVVRLKQSFLHVFSAIELNSRGAYRIVYNLAEHESGNYLINFEITSGRADTVELPAVFQDVMRDVIANARKYTQPGGRIDAGLYCGDDEIRFVVEDTGAGIPSDEIDRVVLFGERGSNVQDRPTRGGGFGLTKALFVTRKFGGRMWIESPVSEGRGTRIEIRIPLPN